MNNDITNIAFGEQTTANEQRISNMNNKTPYRITNIW